MEADGISGISGFIVLLDCGCDLVGSLPCLAALRVVLMCKLLPAGTGLGARLFIRLSLFDLARRRGRGR